MEFAKNNWNLANSPWNHPQNTWNWLWIPTVFTHRAAIPAIYINTQEFSRINEVYVISLKNAECMSIIAKYQLTPPGVQNSSNSQSISRILGRSSAEIAESKVHEKITEFSVISWNSLNFRGFQMYPWTTSPGSLKWTVNYYCFAHRAG